MILLSDHRTIEFVKIRNYIPDVNRSTQGVPEPSALKQCAETLLNRTCKILQIWRPTAALTSQQLIHHFLRLPLSKAIEFCWNENPGD